MALAGAGAASEAAGEATGRAVPVTAIAGGSPSPTSGSPAVSPGGRVLADRTSDEPSPADPTPADGATPADGSGSSSSSSVQDDGEQDDGGQAGDGRGGGGRALLGGLAVVGAVLLWFAGVALRGRAAARAERSRG